MDLPFIIQQGLVLLGISATVVLGVLSRTGPRRRIENIKLGAEAAKAVDDPKVRARINQFIIKQNRQLERSLDRAGLRRWAGIVAGLLLGSIAILVTNLLLELAFPREPDETINLDADAIYLIIFGLLSLSGILSLLIFIGRRIYEAGGRDS